MTFQKPEKKNPHLNKKERLYLQSFRYNRDKHINSTDQGKAIRVMDYSQFNRDVKY